MPESSTLTLRKNPSAAGKYSRTAALISLGSPREARTQIVATGSKLHCVRDEIRNDLSQPHRIAKAPAWQARIDLPGERRLRFPGLGLEQFARFTDGLADIEGLVLDRKLACLDLREIQDIVDDREKRPSAGSYRFDEATLVVIERRVRQQVGKSQDTVERRPDFVAHDRRGTPTSPAWRPRAFG